MTFEKWWADNGARYWGAPVFAAKDAWAASEQRVLDALDELIHENQTVLDAIKLRQEIAAALKPRIIPQIPN